MKKMHGGDNELKRKMAEKDRHSKTVQKLGKMGSPRMETKP